jgi:hypothetical protein
MLEAGDLGERFAGAFNHFGSPKYLFSALSNTCVYSHLRKYYTEKEELRKSRFCRYFMYAKIQPTRKLFILKKRKVCYRHMVERK